MDKYYTKEGFGIYVLNKDTRKFMLEERKSVGLFIDTFGLSALQIGLLLYSETENDFLKVCQVCVNLKDKCIGVYLEKSRECSLPLNKTVDAPGV